MAALAKNHRRHHFRKAYMLNGCAAAAIILESQRHIEELIILQS